MAIRFCIRKTSVKNDKEVRKNRREKQTLVKGEKATVIRTIDQHPTSHFL